MQVLGEALQQGEAAMQDFETRTHPSAGWQTTFCSNGGLWRRRLRNLWRKGSAQSSRRDRCPTRDCIERMSDAVGVSGIVQTQLQKSARQCGAFWSQSLAMRCYLYYFVPKFALGLQQTRRSTTGRSRLYQFPDKASICQHQYVADHHMTCVMSRQKRFS